MVPFRMCHGQPVLLQNRSAYIVQPHTLVLRLSSTTVVPFLLPVLRLVRRHSGLPSDSAIRVSTLGCLHIPLNRLLGCCIFHFLCRIFLDRLILLFFPSYDSPTDKTMAMQLSEFISFAAPDTIISVTFFHNKHMLEILVRSAVTCAFVSVNRCTYTPEMKDENFSISCC